MFCAERYGGVAVHLQDLTAVKLYLFMLLAICLLIMCFMPSTWKVRSAIMVNWRNGEACSTRCCDAARLSRSRVGELSS